MSTFVKNLNDGTINLADGTGTPVTLDVPFSTGDLKISGLSETQQNVSRYETRGQLNTVRHTSRTYPTGSFSFQLAEFSDATVGTVADFVLKRNKYSGNASTLTSGDVYCIDITLTVEGTDHGDSADHSVTLTECDCTFEFAEGDPNAGTVNFTCNGSVNFV